MSGQGRTSISEVLHRSAGHFPTLSDAETVEKEKHGYGSRVSFCRKRRRLCVLGSCRKKDALLKCLSDY